MKNSKLVSISIMGLVLAVGAAVSIAEQAGSNSALVTHGPRFYDDTYDADFLQDRVVIATEAMGWEITSVDSRNGVVQARDPLGRTKSPVVVNISEVDGGAKRIDVNLATKVSMNDTQSQTELNDYFQRLDALVQPNNM
ncbi:MAG: hypothetical protein OEZ43_07520 [Gammaproteobacteria bacterium]|nr:hypothetical protein [Gammaproteobacteria bacterium]